MTAERRDGEGRPKLGYSFTPTPRWVRRDRREGLLAEEAYDLISELYDRADTDALIGGLESPTLTLDVTKTAIGYKHDLDSLAHWLRRLKGTGRYFTFRVVGNSRTGFSYVFRLFTADPGSPVSVRSADTVSVPCPPVIPHDDRAEGDRARESCPSVAESCPTVPMEQTGMVEPETTGGQGERVRALQTFSDNYTTRSEENLVGRESDTDQDHDVGNHPRRRDVQDSRASTARA